MKTENKSEGNLFDKIFKENIAGIFIPLIESYLDVKIRTKRRLQPKLHTTLEREVDFLYDVKLANEQTFLLHLEFQTLPDKEMVYRMAEYHGILLKKYKKEIKHFVIYLGKRKTTISLSLEENMVFSNFTMIDLQQLDASKFLKSQIPEELILSILCNYPEEQTEDILRSTLEKLQRATKNPNLFNKFVKQLLILSRLRKIEDQTLKIINEMPVIIDIENDTLFKQGIEKGIQKGMERGMEKGMEEGIQKGMEKGMERGIERGIERGMERGMEKSNLKTILVGLKNGLSIDLISEITGLSPRQIDDIILRNNKN